MCARLRIPRIPLYAVVIVVALAAAKTPLPPVERVPPVGWETRVTPGFDPPIEYFIAYGPNGFESQTPEQQKEVVEKWGPNALDVLKRLADDPGWAAYRSEIQSIIPLVKSPEVAVLMVAEARKQLDGADSANKPAELWNALARLANADYDAFVTLMDERFATVSPDRQRTLAGILCAQLRGDHAADCEARLNEIAKSTGDETIKKTISAALVDAAARKRASEPMQKVLDAERGKEKQP